MARNIFLHEKVSILIFRAFTIMFYWFKKKNQGKKISIKCEIDSCNGDGDWNRVKFLALMCKECNDCVIGDSGCCVNCSANQQYISTEKHCHNHEHKHSHNHYQHSQTIDFRLLFLPLMLVAVIFRIFNYIRNKNYGSK
jgi:hypothetical protein